jgi:hypothetical protein
MALQETARAAPAIAGSDPQKSSCLAADTFTNNSKTTTDQARLRLQYLVVRHLHKLGPKPLFFFLRELERGAELLPLLEIYAALPVELIRHCRGDQFATALHCIDGRQA